MAVVLHVKGSNGSCLQNRVFYMNSFFFLHTEKFDLGFKTTVSFLTVAVYTF